MTCWATDFLTRNPDLAARPYGGVRHGLVFDMGGKERRLDAVGKPAHYLDAGLWKPIDTTLVLQTGNYYSAPGTPARFNVSDRTVEILNSTYAQRTTRVAILDGATLAISGARNLPVGSRSGDSLLADGTIGGAAWQHQLRLTEDGVRETITLQSKPVGLPADLNDWLVLDTILGGVTFPDGWLDEFETAGFRFHSPEAWDANHNRPNCRRYARTVGGVQHLYTGIPVAWLATAAYPVVIDPDFAGDAADAHIYGDSTSWATARSTRTGYDTSGSSVDLNHDFTSPNYEVRRGLVKFPTNTIGAGSTVTQVNLKLTHLWGIIDTTHQDVQICKDDWSATDPFDWTSSETAYDAILAATLDDAIWRNTSGMADNTQYASGNLATAWVNKTGSTYYGLLLSRDRSNSTPTDTCYVSLGAADHATSAYRPVLTVLYSAAATGVVPRRALLGVGC
jgi:hypothetical protein